MKNSTKKVVAWITIWFFAIGEFASTVRLWVPQLGWWSLLIAFLATCGWYFWMAWAMDNRK